MIPILSYVNDGVVHYLHSIFMATTFITEVRYNFSVNLCKQLPVFWCGGPQTLLMQLLTDSA